MRPTALPLVLLLLAALVTPAAASPQPTPVCGFCGSQFEAATVEHGINATVTESTVVIQVHDNGSAVWTIRNRLSTGAEAFRENPDRLNRIAKSLLEEHYGLPGDATFVSARMDGDNAVLTYRDADAATRHAGLLVVEYLHDGGYEPRYHVNADRFTIRGPEGTVVTNDPDSGSVDGRSVTWRGTAGNELYGSTDLAGSPYVVFGSDHSVATQARTTVAVALATLPIVIRGVQSFLLWQTVLFALVLAGVIALLRTRRFNVGIELLAGVVTGLGALGTVVPALANGPGWVSGPPLLGVGIGLLAQNPQTRKQLRTPRGQALAAAAVLIGTFAVLVGLNVAVGESWANPVAVAFRTTAIAFPLAALLPLGGALEADRRQILRWGALAVAAFVLVPAAVVNLVDPPSGLGGGLFAVFLFIAAVLTPLIGVLVLMLGRSLATRSS